MVRRRPRATPPPQTLTEDDADDLTVEIVEADYSLDGVVTLLLNIREQLECIEAKADIIMAQNDDQQASIDAGTAALTALTGDVATNVAQLQADVEAIKAALVAVPADVDTTALQAAVDAATSTAASLDTAVAGVTATTTAPAAADNTAGGDAPTEPMPAEPADG